MKRFTVAMFIAYACTMAAKVCAQQTCWTQYSAALNYESFGGTYEKSGYTLSADIDVHWRSPLFGSLLVGYSWYDGSKPVTVDYSTGAVDDNVSDRKTQLMFAIGPGLDLLSNNIDRFYLALYGGYAIVRYEHAYFTGTERHTPEDDLDGVMCLGRLGYEHQFGRSTTVGVFVQGSYVGKEFNWGVGLRVGFRTSTFNVKKPMRVR